VHIPTFWKFVLSLHGQWAYVKPYGQSDLTDIQAQLFHLGGSDTVRGYALARWAFPASRAIRGDK